MPIKASRCSARPWREIRPRLRSVADSYIAGGKAGGGVEVLGVREPRDRQAARSKCRGPGRGPARQAGQDLAVGAGQQHLDLLLDRGHVDKQTAIADEITAQPLCAGSGIRWRWEAIAPPAGPVLSGGLRQPSGRPGDQRPTGWGTTGEGRRARQRGLTGGRLDGSERPCPAGADKPGRNAFSLSWSRCWAFFRSATSPRRCRTAARNSSTTASSDCRRPAP